MPFADASRPHLPGSSVRKLHAGAQDDCRDARAGVGTAASGQTSPVQPIVEMQRGRNSRAAPGRPWTGCDGHSPSGDAIRPPPVRPWTGSALRGLTRVRAQGRLPVPARRMASPTSTGCNESINHDQRGSLLLRELALPRHVPCSQGSRHHAGIPSHDACPLQPSRMTGQGVPAPQQGIDAATLSRLSPQLDMMRLIPFRFRCPRR